ncbi:hypothetical protein V5O48_002215 [Marasmius crinis-equi]|uniref:Uncharacterized protein n=1 Tax=Marasmius crinis-equi TaxID=585013 RepID=A0ABR3FWD9_9AGAR
MSYPPYLNNPSYPQSSPRDNYHEDPKPAFDDLIDEYTQPYAANARHQTYTVQTDTRAPSQTMPSKPPPLFTKHSNDSSRDLNSVGYPPATLSKDIDNSPWWKKIFQLLPDSMACRLFVLTVILETIIDLAIEGELLVRITDGGGGDRRMPVYLSIFALAHVFQLVMAIDAVYARNTLQFIFLTLFNGVFLIYSVIQISEIREAAATQEGVTNIPINVLTTIIPIVIAVAELAYIGLGWKIYDEFGWKVYKFLGADRRIKKMYANYQIYECLIKFDVFFWAGFSVQFIWLVLNKDDWEYYVTCAALPLSLVLLVEGHLAARHENKWMMATFLSGCVSAMIYFVYKLVKVLMYKDQKEFIRTWKSLTVFSVIAIIFLTATFVFSILVMRKFGYGLKAALARKNQHQRFDSRPINGLPASMNPNRMSID